MTLLIQNTSRLQRAKTDGLMSPPPKKPRKGLVCAAFDAAAAALLELSGTRAVAPLAASFTLAAASEGLAGGATSSTLLFTISLAPASGDSDSIRNNTDQFLPADNIRSNTQVQLMPTKQPLLGSGALPKKLKGFASVAPLAFCAASDAAPCTAAGAAFAACTVSFAASFTSSGSLGRLTAGSFGSSTSGSFGSPAAGGVGVLGVNGAGPRHTQSAVSTGALGCGVLCHRRSGRGPATKHARAPGPHVQACRRQAC